MKKDNPYNILFSTQRLFVRPLTMDDADAFHELESDPRVLQFTGKDPINSPVENQSRLIDAIEKSKDPNLSLYVWAICLKSDQSFVGTCAIFLSEENEYEIGYRILWRHWQKGYASEVVNPLIQYGLRTLQLPALAAYVFSANKASVRILDNSSMTLIKEFFNETHQQMDRYYKVQNTNSSLLP